MPKKYSCENSACPVILDGHCNYAEQVVGQANTTLNKEITPQFTRSQLGRVIDNFKVKAQDKYCRPGEDEALQLALEYATNIMSQMPE